MGTKFEIITKADSGIKRKGQLKEKVLGTVGSSAWARRWRRMKSLLTALVQ
jgi:hypothetical protein